MNLTETENTKNINCDDNVLEITENSSDTEVISVTDNISRVRLTLEEIIANDNDTSRQNYLSPTPSPSPLLSDASSVSSSFPSETGSFVSTSSSSVRSGFDTASILSTYRSFNDPFRGVDDDEFANLDRYGFLNNKLLCLTINEREFMEAERRRL